MPLFDFFAAPSSTFRYHCFPFMIFEGDIQSPYCAAHIECDIDPITLIWEKALLLTEDSKNITSQDLVIAVFSLCLARSH